MDESLKGAAAGGIGRKRWKMETHLVLCKEPVGDAKLPEAPVGREVALQEPEELLDGCLIARLRESHAQETSDARRLEELAERFEDAQSALGLSRFLCAQLPQKDLLQ
jgi:hypothetical protein